MCVTVQSLLHAQLEGMFLGSNLYLRAIPSLNSDLVRFKLCLSSGEAFNKIDDLSSGARWRQCSSPVEVFLIFSCFPADLDVFFYSFFEFLRPQQPFF